MLYQTDERQNYTSDLALELDRLKIPNVSIEKSNLKKELDYRYSETNRFLMMTDYMNKRRAKFLVDLYGKYVSKEHLHYGNWTPSIAHIVCDSRRIKQMEEGFKSYSKSIEFGLGVPVHPNYFQVRLLPYKEKSESFVFLKDFVSYVNSKL